MEISFQYESHEVFLILIRLHLKLDKDKYKTIKRSLIWILHRWNIWRLEQQIFRQWVHSWIRISMFSLIFSMTFSRIAFFGSFCKIIFLWFTFIPFLHFQFVFKSKIYIWCTFCSRTCINKMSEHFWEFFILQAFRSFNVIIFGNVYNFRTTDWWNAEIFYDQWKNEENYS